MKQSCIMTVVDAEYSGFIGLFLHCARAAYPESEIVVFTRGDSFIKDDSVIQVRSDIYGRYGVVTAALRFLVGEEYLDKYESCFITDVDVLLKREQPGLFEQHKNHMEKYGLLCYSNFAFDSSMCGVHYITKDWWVATDNARQKQLEILENQAFVPSKGYDEKMLFTIIKESGLPYITKPTPWNLHGLHLGMFRKSKGVKKPFLQGYEITQIQEMMDDFELNKIVDTCESSLVHECWDGMVRVFMER